MKAGGVADSIRKKTCNERYGSDYLVSRSDIAKLGSLKGNSPESRKLAARSFKAHLDCYSFQLTRGLTITRSKSEVDFLSALAAELKVELAYQRYKNGWWIDAYCKEYNCWIQFDGVYWHSKPEAQERDLNQDAWFKENGMRLFRITDKEALALNSVRTFADLIRSSASDLSSYSSSATATT
jgi:very-short-patch-repair endonuclease